MTRPRLELDFARTRPKVNRIAVALLAVGAVGASLVLFDYGRASSKVDGLRMQIASLTTRGAPISPDKAATRAAEDAGKAATELATPWSLLLRDLELASRDSKGSVAVLAIEPDREKHRVRVSAEAPSLSTALTYVQRLQQSEALQYPMLETHEVQDKDPQHPVRFQIKADWRLAP
jgi:hypothetical protein